MYRYPEEVVGHVDIDERTLPVERSVLVEPGPDDVDGDYDRYEDAEKWVVELHVPGNRIHEENAEIATIDNVHRDGGHVDDQFLPEDARSEGNKVLWFGGTVCLREAEIIAEESAEEWAERYKSNHGLPKTKLP